MTERLPIPEWNPPARIVAEFGQVHVTQVLRPSQRDHDFALCLLLSKNGVHSYLSPDPESSVPAQPGERVVVIRRTFTVDLDSSRSHPRRATLSVADGQDFAAWVATRNTPVSTGDVELLLSSLDITAKTRRNRWPAQKLALYGLKLLDLVDLAAGDDGTDNGYVAGTRIGSSFELLEELKRGSPERGHVWKAAQLRPGSGERTERLAVVKLGLRASDVDPEVEVRLPPHPNIGRFLQFIDESNGRWHAVFEYVDGCPLREYVERAGGILDEVTVIDVGRAILAALDAAHGAGVVHRDVHPGNVIVREEPGRISAVLLDFTSGARLDAPTLAPPALWSDFSEPKSLRADCDDVQGDLYSVALLILWMAGASVLNGQVQRWPDAAAKLQPVTFRAMGHDRKSRYRTAAEFAAALTQHGQRHQPRKHVRVEWEVVRGVNGKSTLRLRSRGHPLAPFVFSAVLVPPGETPTLHPQNGVWRPEIWPEWHNLSADELEGALPDLAPGSLIGIVATSSFETVYEPVPLVPAFHPGFWELS